ncbi:OPT oligopeptide transporter family [Purpureocillium lavendulum]|uniref:OPT oligopeptide transporter family n=1 Tax=Purpureocillium lavendulum TaxID=1247861 RepID=A0AB34FWJ5_9HYPO|nr:OPT oligopeptide transporter family [Purpureocillium lavendulum]
MGIANSPVLGRPETAESQVKLRGAETFDTNASSENDFTDKDRNEQDQSGADSVTTVAQLSEDELRAALRALIEEHELDQNFCHDILDRARAYLAKSPPDEASPKSEEDVEAARAIIEDFRAQEELARNNSAYPEVRAVVDPTDDPTLPVGTFRVFLLGTFFAIFGTALHQFFSMRMPSIHISTYVVQLLTLPLGTFFAKVLPTRLWTLCLPRTTKSFSFTLNPGPFNQKEHLLVAMMANVAFAGHHDGAYVISIVQVLKLPMFYKEKVLSNSLPWQAITIMATQLLGYGCAGIARRFLVYPPAMIWPRALANMGLAKALYADKGVKVLPAVNGWTMTRYRFFAICFVGMFIWFWIPNYLFQAIALFNWPTWISPGNVQLALIMGSTCGLGINPLSSLDWNVATHHGDPIVTPFFSLMNYASGMALFGFIVAPILYFKNFWNTGYLPINSNKPFDNTGGRYNISRIVGKDFTIDEAAYFNYSVPWLSATKVIYLTVYFMLYASLPVHLALWFRKDIAKGLRGCFSRKKESKQQFEDVHNRLMSAYKECPHWWYLSVLGISFTFAVISAVLWPTGMPVWGIIFAIVFTVVLQIPLGMLAAITNKEVSTSILAMVVGGYVLEGKTIPNMIFKMYTFMATSQSLHFIADLKLAHYAKIPPRWAFIAQVYATIVAAFVALGVNHWAMRNIEGVCRDDQKDRFTCPATHSYYLTTVLWGVVGPRRLFGTDGHYKPIIYFIPIGVVLPFVTYYFAKRWPTSFWRYFNAPIFFGGALGWAPYNWTYMQGSVIFGIIFNYFIKKRAQGWWGRYAYVMSGSFQAAIGVGALVMYFCFQMWKLDINWIGNTIGRQGVDYGGWKDAMGHKVKCANLNLPRGSKFATGFEHVHR